MLTYLIIALTCLVSIPAFQNRELFSKMLFNPSIIRNHKEWYRFLTHALLHSDWMHLAFNMYGLYLFGSLVEEAFLRAFGIAKGEIYFFLLYFTSIFASVIPSYEKHKNDYSYNAVGASGAVLAVMFSSILLDPTMKLMLMFLPIPIPSPIFGVLFLAYSWYSERNRREGDNQGHDAHYWGSLFGVVFTLVVLPQTFFSFIDAVKHLF